VVADLDRLESHSVGFVLHGKTHIIRPIRVKEFYAVLGKLSAFMDLSKKEKLTDDELNQGYLEIIKSLCDSVTLKDIEKCTRPQIAGMFQIIVNCILGKAQVGERHPLDGDETQEKKSLVNP
jgi:hypothetical protein